MGMKLPANYRPSRDEPFMNKRQLEYFRLKLLAWHTELLEDYNETRNHLKKGERAGSDFADMASAETDHAQELRTRDRERKLTAKIDQALERIENGTFGYCAETGNPIGLARLEARPVASLSIEAQERHEEEEIRGLRG
ncbi:MAG: RNA polymerase-binding protein DksA [Candidatus Krumholzibacteria bacterium]|nr:RNA polymerase-binding protein DksA [Candidatus Krumholzibacteria bacterium]